jgi:hypothetical protein
MALLPILLPKDFSPKISVSNVVSIGDILASKNTGKEEFIPLAKDLGISSIEALRCLKKGLGDKIEKGEILAEKKKIIGVSRIFSPFSGTIARLEESTGRLCILTQTQENIETIKSPVDGKVTFCDNNKIVLETEKDAVVADKVSGSGIRGELFLIPGEEISPDEVTNNLIKKIALGISFEKAALSKALALGASGIIGVVIKDEDINDFKEREIKNPIFKITLDNFKKLAADKGREVYLDTENKIIIVL